MSRTGKTNHIGHFITKTVSPIGQKFGFVQASLLLDWPEIVGSFAQYCQPIKVTFPYQQRRGGQLHVRVTSGMATQLVYYQHQILDKINRYFGYEAIARLTIKQEPVFTFTKEPPTEKPPLPEDVVAKICETVADIKDDRLRAALMALGQGIKKSEIGT